MSEKLSALPQLHPLGSPILKVSTRNIGNHSNIGSSDGSQSLDFTRRIHSHFNDGGPCVGLPIENRSGYTDRDY